MKKQRTLIVPRIDMNALKGDDAIAKCEAARQIDEVSRGHGFFYAANHGIDVENLVDTTRFMHQAVPDDEKFDLAITAYNAQNDRSRAGFYLSIEGKKAPESFCYLNPKFAQNHPLIADATPMHEINVWPLPRDGKDWQGFFESYYWQIFELSKILLSGYALALDQAEDFFEPFFRREDTLSAVSLIRYPYLKKYPTLKTANDGTLLSFGEHLDVSLLTVLYQTPVANLQVEFDGDYYDIPPNGEDYLVNCGTYMEHLTAGAYPARKHRVVFINEERLSLPFFVNLGHRDAPVLVRNDAADESTNCLNYGAYLANGLGDLIIKNGQT